SSRGAVMARAVPVAGLDMWNLASETYKLNFPLAYTYSRKAQWLSPHRVLEDTGKIDLILASPECTSHSVAKGGARRCEKSRETPFEVVRFAKVLKPRWIVIENVDKMQEWKRFEELLEKLRRLGYKLAHGVLDAQYFGTPQTRRRLFIVCDLEK